MKKNLVAFSLLVLIASSIIAQQNIDPAPKTLADLTPSMFNLENFTDRWLKVIKVINASMSLGIPVELDSNADVLLADGLLAEEVHYCYYTYYPEDEASYELCRQQWYLDDQNPDHTPEFHQFMHTIYASKDLQKLAYQWLKPNFIRLFSDIDVERKQTLCSIMAHGFYYAHKMHNSPKQLACELTYLELEKTKAQRDQNDTFSYFHWYRPNQSCDGPMHWEDDTQPFRKLEAWIIRRHQDQHMSFAEMADWFNKIQHDVLICGA